MCFVIDLSLFFVFLTFFLLHGIILKVHLSVNRKLHEGVRKQVLNSVASFNCLLEALFFK